MDKSEMLKMLAAPLNMAVKAVEELEQTITLFEKDHGMEPSFSKRITGTQPKYSNTIQNLVDLNNKQRDKIRKMETEIALYIKEIEEIKNEIANIRTQSRMFKQTNTKMSEM